MSTTEELFYILSIKHTHNRDAMLTWWRPDCSGYTWYLDGAGRYTWEEVKEFDIDDGRDTRAIACDIVHKFADRYRCAPKEGDALKWLNGVETQV